MKKISIISILSALVLPAFAEEAKPVAETAASTEEASVVEQYSQQFEQPKVEHEIYYNSKTQFPHGLQIGLGLSPTSGLNAFVGYNNKNFDILPKTVLLILVHLYVIIVPASLNEIKTSPKYNHSLLILSFHDINSN